MSNLSCSSQEESYCTEKTLGVDLSLFFVYIALFPQVLHTKDAAHDLPPPLTTNKRRKRGIHALK